MDYFFLGWLFKIVLRQRKGILFPLSGPLRPYERANTIMAFGAHQMQKDLKWGLGGPITVECEIDATVICKWKVVEDGHVVYYYYCYMGAR